MRISKVEITPDKGKGGFLGYLSFTYDNNLLLDDMGIYADGDEYHIEPPSVILFTKQFHKKLIEKLKLKLEKM